MAGILGMQQLFSNFHENVWSENNFWGWYHEQNRWPTATRTVRSVKQWWSFFHTGFRVDTTLQCLHILRCITSGWNAITVEEHSFRKRPALPNMIWGFLFSRWVRLISSSSRSYLPEITLMLKISLRSHYSDWQNGIWFSAKGVNFSFHHYSETSTDTHLSSCLVGTGGSFIWVKQQGNEFLY